MAKSDDDKEQTTTEMAKSIWLAGLGAYGRVLGEAQERAKEVAKAPPKLFDELVAKGARLDEQARSLINEAKEEQLSGLESRIQRVKESFAFSPLFPPSEQQQSLYERVDQIEQKLDYLISIVEKLQTPVAKAQPRRRKSTVKSDASTK